VAYQNIMLLFFVINQQAETLAKVELIIMNEIFKFYISVLITINLLLLMGTSCSTDIDYNPSPIPRSLVAYSILKADSTLSVLVTSTQNLTDKEISYVSDATVKIYDEHNLLLDSAEYTEDGRYLSSYKVFANQKLTIKVESPGFNAISASDYAPSKIEIKEASYQENYEYDAVNDYMYGLITMTFQDNPNEKNYYEIVIVVDQGNGTFWRVTPFIVSNEFMNIHSHEGNKPQSILFNDALFNGKEIALRIKAQAGSSIPYIIFRNTSETYYRYQNSLYSYLFTVPEKNDGFFTVEPLNLYTNIIDGFGIIAGYNQSEYQIVEIEKEQR
jgi:hypothetical protein